MKISSKGLFIEGFGVKTATPAQLAILEIADGDPLSESEHPDVISLLGGAEAVEQYTSLHTSRPPKELLILAGIRGGKSQMACAIAVRTSLTADLSGLKPGETPRVAIVSVSRDSARSTFGQLSGMLNSHQELRQLIINESQDTLTIRRPSDGRLVEICVVAASVAGRSLVSRWILTVIFEEAARFGDENAAVNLSNMRSSVLGRVVDGGQIVYVSSPWLPTGWCYEQAEANFGKPRQDLVVLRAPGPALNPTWWTDARCSAVQATDEIAYWTDVRAEFAQQLNSMFSIAILDSATREKPPVLPPRTGARYIAAVDPSEGTGRNGFALAVVELNGDTNRVVLTKEFEGGLLSVWSQIAATLEPYGIKRLKSDGYAASANAALAMTHNLHLEITRSTAGSKVQGWENLKVLIETGQLELPPDPTLRNDLLLVRKKLLPNGGVTIDLIESGGRHCDMAAALCTAVGELETNSWTRSWLEAFTPDRPSEIRGYR